MAIISALSDLLRPVWQIFVVAIALLLSRVCFANPAVSVQPARHNDKNGCGFWGDSIILSVKDFGREIAQKRYCSAYGKGNAQLIADARGEKYVLVTFAKGHGPNAWSDYLSIYKLNDTLVKKRSLIISEPSNYSSRWRYSYRIKKPMAGGLEFMMTLRLDGEQAKGLPLPKKTKIVAIDMVR